MSVAIYVPASGSLAARYLPRNLSNISDVDTAQRTINFLRSQSLDDGSAIVVSREAPPKPCLRKTQSLPSMESQSYKTTDNLCKPSRSDGKHLPMMSSSTLDCKPPTETFDKRRQCICEQRSNSLTEFCTDCIRALMGGEIGVHVNGHDSHENGDTHSEITSDSGIMSPKQNADFFCDPFSEDGNEDDLSESSTITDDEYSCHAGTNGSSAKCACTDCLQKDLTNAIWELDRLSTDQQEYEPTLKKSRSLKSTKTPPSEHIKKKVVRFADAFGFDLETVRHVFNVDVPPVIPVSATAHLNLEPDSLYYRQRPKAHDYVTELTQTFSLHHGKNFIEKVWYEKVVLEEVTVNELTVTGLIRVANLAFHKGVFVRYSLDLWRTFYDVPANYVMNSSNGSTDVFSFAVFAPSTFRPGDCLQLAICYRVAGDEHWDNQGKRNYVFEAVARPIYRYTEFDSGIQYY